jgi:hypothetical protein
MKKTQTAEDAQTAVWIVIALAAASPWSAIVSHGSERASV